MQEYQPISQIVYKLKIYCPYLFLFSLFYNFYREKKVGVISFYKYQKLMVSTNYWEETPCIIIFYSATDNTTMLFMLVPWYI
jgi:hypothetical protein